MENTAEQHSQQVRTSLIKKTVEALLLSIEDKAASSPESAKQGELNFPSSEFFCWQKFFLVILEDLLALSDILGVVVERALEVVDNHKINVYRSLQSGREVYEILGGLKPYFSFPNVPFCPCLAFHNQVLGGGQYCCKHYIATRIARALGTAQVIEKTQQEFRNILKCFQL